MYARNRRKSRRFVSLCPANPWISSDLLTLSSSVATQQCANKFALPSLLHRFSPRQTSSKLGLLLWLNENVGFHLIPNQR